MIRWRNFLKCQYTRNVTKCGLEGSTQAFFTSKTPTPLAKLEGLRPEIQGMPLFKKLPILALTLGGYVAAGQIFDPYDRPRNFDPWELDGPIHQMKQADGLDKPISNLADKSIVIVEAEHIMPQSLWEAETNYTTIDGSTYTGDGFVRYTGPSWIGAENLADPDQSRQGRKESWMVVKFWVEYPGLYELDVRGYHVLEDGDNDFWMGYFPMQGTIERWLANDHLTFSWNRGGQQLSFNCQAGLNAVFVNGRSNGFAVDRLAIYKKFPINTGGNARDIARGPTPVYPSRAGTVIHDLDRWVPPHESTTTFSNWLGSIHYSEEVFPWFFHFQLGWLYAGPGNKKGGWIYDFRLGYLYASDKFPGLYYRLDSASWLIHVPVPEDSRRFYDYTLQDYINGN